MVSEEHEFSAIPSDMPTDRHIRTVHDYGVFHLPSPATYSVPFLCICFYQLGCLNIFTPTGKFGQKVAQTKIAIKAAFDYRVALEVYRCMPNTAAKAGRSTPVWYTWSMHSAVGVCRAYRALESL